MLSGFFRAVSAAHAKKSILCSPKAFPVSPTIGTRRMALDGCLVIHDQHFIVHQNQEVASILCDYPVHSLLPIVSKVSL